MKGRVTYREKIVGVLGSRRQEGKTIFVMNDRESPSSA